MKKPFVCELSGCTRSFKSLHALHVHQSSNRIHSDSRLATPNGSAPKKNERARSLDAHSELIVFGKMMDLFDGLSPEGKRWVRGKLQDEL